MNRFCSTPIANRPRRRTRCALAHSNSRHLTRRNRASAGAPVCFFCFFVLFFFCFLRERADGRDSWTAPTILRSRGALGAVESREDSRRARPSAPSPSKGCRFASLSLTSRSSQMFKGLSEGARARGDARKAKRRGSGRESREATARGERSKGKTGIKNHVYTYYTHTHTQVYACIWVDRAELA